MVAQATAVRALVLVVGMLKGGTGKTTSAIFIAVWFALKGKRVVVLDADGTSQSAHDWARLASAAGNVLPFEVIRLRGEYDVIVVDAGGGSAQILEEACSAADVLLMPISPTGADTRRLAATLQSAERAAARNPAGLTAYVTIVKADRRTSQPRRWRDQLVADGHPLTDTVISDRVLYSDAYGRRPDHAGEYGPLLDEVTQELMAK